MDEKWRVVTILFPAFVFFQAIHIFEEIWAEIYVISPFKTLLPYLFAASFVLMASLLFQMGVFQKARRAMIGAGVVVLITGILNPLVHGIGWAVTGQYFQGIGAGTVTGVLMLVFSGFLLFKIKQIYYL
jgi:hypothetical protein